MKITSVGNVLNFNVAFIKPKEDRDVSAWSVAYLCNQL